MDTHDWMNSVNLAFSPKKIDMYIKKILYEIQQNLESVHLQNGVKILVKTFS